MNEQCQVDDDGLEFLEHSEGLRLIAYPDPGTGNYPFTIGYGHTAHVHPGDTCTPELAAQWLRDDLNEAYLIIQQHVTVPLDQGQFNAIASFVFNIGPGIPNERDGFVWLHNGNHSTILTKLNAGDYDGASREFRKWANPPLLGLRIRRERERVMFTGGDWRTVPDNREPLAA